MSNVTAEELESLLKQNEVALRQVAKHMKLWGGTEDDLMQEGRIGFVQGVKTFNPERVTVQPDESLSSKQVKEALVSFSMMCAKRQMLDAIRHAGRKKYAPHFNAVSLSSGLPVVDKLVEGPEERVLEQESQSEILSSVTLTSSEKRVIELLLLGQSVDEIAQTLGRSKKAVDDLFYRIRKKVKGV